MEWPPTRDESEKGEAMMTFATAIQTVFRKYAVFQGRAGRAEFWWWTLFTTLVSAALNTLTVTMTPLVDMPYMHLAYHPASGLAGAWSLAVLVPSLAVAVRRLRDAGYRWTYLFWLLLPVAGLIVVVVLLAQPSVPGPQAPVPSEPGSREVARS
jgi:uncharacterized membrane protein YhaH (DUF805 family)